MDHYADRLAAAIQAKGAPVCVGIDPVLAKLPPALQPTSSTLAAAVDAIESFAQTVITAVAPHVPAVKINSAFFEAFYADGVAAYYRLVEHAHAAGLLVIGDIKRGDIGSTAERYAQGHLAAPGFPDVPSALLPDAVTLAGYLGRTAVAPFVAAARATGRGLYVLVRPSEPEADRVHEFGGATPFFEHMARLVAEWGADDELIGAGGLSCVGAVVAPKDEASTRRARELLPRAPFLVPGYGAQGAGATACVPCFGGRRDAALVNASRSVIYAFSQDRYRQHHGDDWVAAVQAAAADFAADITGVAPA
jgi:orotidine-5'-phosphate decarboxylase